MAEYALKAQIRTECGKNKNYRLRTTGITPGVFYNYKGENFTIQVDAIALAKVIRGAGRSKLIDLEIEGKGTYPILIGEVQRHPLKNMYNHIDFIGVDLDKPTEIGVPIVLVGRSKGVAMGGKLELFEEELQVSCLPTLVPDAIEINITDIAINQKLYVNDVILPEGVKAVYKQNIAVLEIKDKNAEQEATEAAS